MDEMHVYYLYDRDLKIVLKKRDFGLREIYLKMWFKKLGNVWLQNIYGTYTEHITAAVIRVLFAMVTKIQYCCEKTHLWISNVYF